MTHPTATAFRILGHFWLEEVRAADMATIAALPELAETLPGHTAADLDALAVEYQRLFGFNLPPYESIFIDPSTMLLAPATERLVALYRRAGWTPPAGSRAGAPDHLGLELLALADFMEQQPPAAEQLLARHVALWLPAFVSALERLAPAPFYAALAGLTLQLTLSTLADVPSLSGNPFPVLPPPPVYRGSGPDEFSPGRADSPEPAEPELRLRDVVGHLLPPSQVGLYLTREDIARVAQNLGLPASMGDRRQMLESLFRQAGEFELVPALLAELTHLFDHAASTYTAWATDFPAWRGYADAWQSRLQTGQQHLQTLEQTLAQEQALWQF